MTAAIFGLLGVIVGGFVTAGVELTLRQRQEKRAQRLALRVLSDELLSLLSWVDVILGHIGAPDPPLEAVRLTVDELVADWRDHRIALADLDYACWREIRTAVWAALHLPTDPSGQALQTLRSQIADALNAIPKEAA